MPLKTVNRWLHRKAYLPALVICTGVAGSPLLAAETPQTDTEKRKTSKNDSKYYLALERMQKAKSGRDILRHVKVLSEGYPDSRAIVVQTTKRGTSLQRKFAFKILGERGNAKDDLKVVTVGLSDRNAKVRLAAAMAIRRLGPEGFPELRKYLLRETDDNNLKMAIKTLQEWKLEEGVTPLVQLLEKNDDRGVRNFCFVALTRLTGKKLGKSVEAWKAYAKSQETLRRENLLRKERKAS